MKTLPTIASALHPVIYAYMRHFPLTRGKRRLLSRVRQSFLPGQPIRRTRLEVANILMECDLRHYIQGQLYFLGYYEPEQVAFWMKLAKQAEVIFDVGANVGLYSLAAAASNPSATIHAFEPTPEVMERFQTNIALNQCQHVIANPLAVGQRTGEIFLHFSGGEDGTNEGMNYVSPVSDQVSDRIVNMTSLDDYCQQRQIDSISLMKVDIEGYEHSALCGAEQLLARSAIHCIFMELNSWAVERSGHTLSEITALLSDHNYQFYEIREDRLVGIADRSRLVDKDVVVIPAAQVEGIGRYLV